MKKEPLIGKRCIYDNIQYVVFSHLLHKKLVLLKPEKEDGRTPWLHLKEEKVSKFY